MLFMLNAIKRTWIPKNAARLPSSTAQASEAGAAPSIYAGLCMFDDLPSPHAVEVDTESVWAAFEDVQPMAVPG